MNHRFEIVAVRFQPVKHLIGGDNFKNAVFADIAPFFGFAELIADDRAKRVLICDIISDVRTNKSDRKSVV